MREAPEEAKKTGPSTPVAADRPIVRRDQDRLGRHRFAKLFAEEIVAMPAGESVVFGLSGAWGTGKTSVLNLVEEELKANGSDFIVIRFNPWLFSGTAELVNDFLAEMSSQLLELPDPKVQRVGSGLQRYGKLLGPLRHVSAAVTRAIALQLDPVTGALVGSVGSVLESSIQATSESLQNTGEDLAKRAEQPRQALSARKQRSLIEEALVATGKRFVVMVDDIDRLRGEEIRDVMRLVRLTADFPNVAYVLSFDRPHVEKALAVGEDDGDGRAYLEKICQTIHDLPTLRRSDLSTLLEDRVNAAFANRSESPNEQEQMLDVFHQVALPLFATPRDVTRFTNALAFAERALGEEVAATDILALEAIRTMLPTVFAALQSAEPALMGAEVKDGKASIEQLRSLAGTHVGCLEALLRLVFPASQKYTANTIFGYEWQRTWRRERRVAHADVFRFYFERTLPETSLRAAEVRALFEALGDEQRLTMAIRALSPQEFEHALTRLEDYEDEFPIEAVEVAVPVLLNEAGGLPQGARSMFDLDADQRLSRIIYRLLKRIGDPARCAEIVDRILPRVHSLSRRFEVVVTVGHDSHGGLRLVDESSASRIEMQLIKDVIATPAAGLRSERLLFYLCRFIEEKSPGDARAFLASVISHDDAMLGLLTSCLGQAFASAVGSVAARREFTLPWDQLEEWFGGDRLQSRIKEARSAATRMNISEWEREALETASRYSEGWRPSIGKMWTKPRE